MAMVRPASAVGTTPTGGSGGTFAPDLEAGHGHTTHGTTTGGTTTNGGHVTPGGQSSLPGVFPLQQQSTPSSSKPHQQTGGTLPSSRPISRAGFVEMASPISPAAGGGGASPMGAGGQPKQSQVHPLLIKHDPLAHAASNYSFTKWAIGLFIIFAIFVVMVIFMQSIIRLAGSYWNSCNE
jgi:hypothetical protein